MQLLLESMGVLPPSHPEFLLFSLMSWLRRASIKHNIIRMITESVREYIRYFKSESILQAFQEEMINWIAREEIKPPNPENITSSSPHGLLITFSSVTHEVTLLDLSSLPALTVKYNF